LIIRYPRPNPRRPGAGAKSENLIIRYPRPNPR
jgi:hypothetical protein